MQEPSVLDFVKTRLHDWRHRILHPSDAVEVESVASEFQAEPALEAVREEPVVVRPTLGERVSQLRWPVFLVLGLALWAQLTFEPRVGQDPSRADITPAEYRSRCVRSAASST